MQRMKTYVIMTVVCAVLLTGASLCMAAEKKVDVDYIAIVNETVITPADLDRELNLTKKHYEAMGSPMFEKHLPKIKKQVVEVLIDRELLYQDSQKQKIVPDDKEVQKLVEEWKAQFAPEGNYQEALTEMGFTETSLQADLKKLVAIEQLIDKQFQPKITVTDKEIKEFYDSHPEFFKQPEQVRVSHILIKVEPGAEQKQKDEARQKLLQIKNKLDEGADFGALAKENSDCPSNAKGGDLGYIRPGMMVKPFEEVAFSLEPNKVSDIVETNFGYHLILVVDKQPAATLSLEESSNNIEQHLKGQKLNQEIRAYVDVLRAKATIKQVNTDNAE